MNHTMTNNLMWKYNRTGCNGKKQFPVIIHIMNKLVNVRNRLLGASSISWFHEFLMINLLFFSAALKYFNKDSEDIRIKRGKEKITTNVKQELAKQVERHLCNAKTRMNRSKNNVQSE